MLSSLNASMIFGLIDPGSATPHCGPTEIRAISGMIVGLE